MERNKHRGSWIVNRASWASLRAAHLKKSANRDPRSTIHDPRAAQAALFAAYLLTALPANMAMADGWQNPTQVAALSDSTTPQATSITVTTGPAQQQFFQITNDDIASAVSAELVSQGIEKQAKATLNPTGSPIFYSANHPLKLALHALQVDPGTHQWQAQAYVLANNQTETMRPVSGHYEATVSVPVLIRQVGKTDVIAATDLTTRDMPERQLRKDTVTDADQLIGKSPHATISADRPIRATEISMPIVIRKGDHVELTYTSQYLSIKTTGIALEDGEQGGTIRVKNEKSEKAVSGKAVAAGTVEVNTDATGS